MSRETMEQARALIQAHQYDEARALLVTVDHPKAVEWIEKIDAILARQDDPFAMPSPALASAPVQVNVTPPAEKKGRGPGCFKIGLGVGCVAPAAFCGAVIVVIIIVAALIQANKESATEDAIKRNGGLGSFEKPIAVEGWAVFDKGKVRAMRLVRPATDMVEEFNMFNPDPPLGADYVLVWFDLECQIDKCNPGALSLHLTDGQKKDWGEPWLLVLDSDFETDAVRGATTSGWQGFQFPTGEPIQTIKIEWGAETLQVQPPTAE